MYAEFIFRDLNFGGFSEYGFLLPFSDVGAPIVVCIVTAMAFFPSAFDM